MWAWPIQHCVFPVKEAIHTAIEAQWSVCCWDLLHATLHS